MGKEALRGIIGRELSARQQLIRLWMNMDLSPIARTVFIRLITLNLNQLQLFSLNIKFYTLLKQWV